MDELVCIPFDHKSCDMDWVASSLHGAVHHPACRSKGKEASMREREKGGRGRERREGGGVPGGQ